MIECNYELITLAAQVVIACGILNIACWGALIWATLRFRKMVRSLTPPSTI